jgi:Mn-dependent transcriptional regulator
MAIHESGENYLETIYALSRKHLEVRAIDIANELNFTRSSVTIAMRKLKKEGYIAIDGDKHISLSDKGKKKAEEIYERHQVIMQFLISNGVQADTAAEDACRIEHYISQESFGCIKKIVNTTANNSESFNKRSIYKE